MLGSLDYNYNLMGDTPILSRYTTTAKWGRNVWKVLRENVTTKIIEILSEYPKLCECYSMDTGCQFQVCKTISRHTQKVLEIAIKYQKGIQEDVCKVVPWKEFLLFLALHDIGKGIAVQKDKRSPPSVHQRSKQAELQISQEILLQVMDILNVPYQRIMIFRQMLSYDSQGPFLLYAIGEDEMFDNLTEMAKACEVDPIAFYKLYQTYHKVDAASYPNLQGDFDYTPTSSGNNIG